MPPERITACKITEEAWKYLCNLQQLLKTKSEPKEPTIQVIWKLFQTIQLKINNMESILDIITKDRLDKEIGKESWTTVIKKKKNNH